MPSDRPSRFFTGRGFNVHHLIHHLPEGIDALDSENILLFSCGLLTGTNAPTGARLHINALSPQTGMLGSSNVGGAAGAWLRSCGVMSVIITGRAKEPAILTIRDSGAALTPAGELWGLDTADTQSRLRSITGDAGVKIFTIGPAGENNCRFANIITGDDHAAGRTGMGAVMGAKQLKAMVIHRGARRPRPHNPDRFKTANRAYVDALKASPDFSIFSTHGGAGYVEWANEMGIVSAYNYRNTVFEGMDRVDGRHLTPRVVKKTGCFSCPVQCKAQLDLRGEKGQPETAHRPEFEPMINLGARCGLSDIDDIVRLDNLCTRLGMDSTSAAGAIAFAMDLYDRGILTDENTGGLNPAWGSSRAMEQLIRQMATGEEGIGNILSQGVMRAAEMIGKGAEKYAAHVKGLELTAYNPVAILGSALGYAVSSRGGDYNNVYASMEHRWSKEKAKQAFGTEKSVDIHSSAGKGPLVRRAVLVNVMVDCLGLCKVPVLSLLGTFNLVHEARLASGFLDREVSPDALFDAGARIADMERLFNLKHAPGPLEDTLPEMFFHRPDHPLTPETVEEMVRGFYRAMGWDEKGIPLRGLEEIENPDTESGTIS